MKVTENELRACLNDIEIETTINYFNAKEFSRDEPAPVEFVHIEGTVINEGIVPGIGMTVRCSQKFDCVQPAHRDYVEASDFTMAPKLKWAIFQKDRICDNEGTPLTEVELIDILRSNSDITVVNPMLAVDD